MAERLTKHAVSRIHERLGVKKRAAQKVAEQARLHGMQPSDTSGRVRAFLDELKCRHGMECDYRITHDGIFAYRHDCLMTVRPFPLFLKRELRTQLNKFNKRRETQSEP